MLNINSLMFATDQHKIITDFYTKIFSKAPDMVEEDWSGWQIGVCFIGFGSHSEIKGHSKEPARIMFNIEIEADQIKSEYERMKNEGATVIKELYEMEGGSGTKIATFADPDGNYFQLMTPFSN